MVYSLSGKTLTTTELNGGYENGADYVIKYNIITLNETTLKMEEIYVNENYPNDSGYNIPQNERTEEVWTRVE